MSIANNTLNLLVIAVLVKRLGGKVTINQSEIDEVAYNMLTDSVTEENQLELTLMKRVNTN